MSGEASVVVDSGPPPQRSRDRVESLVSELLEHVQDSAALLQDSVEGRTASEEQEILLDLSSHGLRCLVLRPKQDSVTLSPREREIARMVALGYSNKTIAAVLDISTWTVGTHMRRIFSKLNVHSRAAMIGALHQHSALG